VGRATTAGGEIAGWVADDDGVVVLVSSPSVPHALAIATTTTVKRANISGPRDVLVSAVVSLLLLV
jgi:hypothetical protein